MVWKVLGLDSDRMLCYVPKEMLLTKIQQALPRQQTAPDQIRTEVSSLECMFN